MARSAGPVIEGPRLASMRKAQQAQPDMLEVSVRQQFLDFLAGGVLRAVVEYQYLDVPGVGLARHRFEGLADVGRLVVGRNQQRDPGE